MKATNNGNALAQKIYKELQTLPEESLVKVADYVDSLRSPARKKVTKPSIKRQLKPTDKPLKIVKLGGILKGYNFSPEMIAEARRDMWKKFADLEK